MNLPLEAPLQEIVDSVLEDKALRLFVKREDLIHETISGNKWRKLFYNLQYAKEKSHSTLITFGGLTRTILLLLLLQEMNLGLKLLGLFVGKNTFH